MWIHLFCAAKKLFFKQTNISLLLLVRIFSKIKFLHDNTDLSNNNVLKQGYKNVLLVLSMLFFQRNSLLITAVTMVAEASCVTFQ